MSPAVTEQRENKTISHMVSAIIMTISIRARKNAFPAKKRGSQIILKISIMVKTKSDRYLCASGQQRDPHIAPAAPPIRRYRIVHTIGNKMRGGDNGGCTSR